MRAPGKIIATGATDREDGDLSPRITRGMECIEGKNKNKKRQASKADGPPLGQRGLLRVADEQLEGGAELLTLCEQLPTVPHAAGQVAVGQYARLVAVRVPPAADLGDHLGHVLVALPALVVGEPRQVRDVARVARGAGDGAGGGDADDAAVEVLETLAAEQRLQVVRGGLERGGRVGGLHAHLETAHGAPAARAHVVEIQVDGADLEIAAGPQDALALGHCVAQVVLRGGRGEPEDDGGEEGLWEWEVGREAAGVGEVAVVRERPEGAERGAG